jgi:hypothetical protein
MAHRHLLVDRVLVSAWKVPEADDIRAIVEQVAAARERLERPVLYLSVIGPSSIPRGEIRDDMVQYYQSMLAHCDSMHIVIEGTEFQQSIKRSVIANVLLVVPSRGRVFIENTLPGVIAASPAPLRVELTRAAPVASEQRLFDFARSAEAPSGR